MCQQQVSRTLLEACSIALPPSPNVSEIDQETTNVPIKTSLEITIDDEDFESECETDTKSPLMQPLVPEKSFPACPSQSSRRKSKKSANKSVRFDQAVTCRPCLHRTNYTKEEAKSSHYSRKEFEMIRRDLLETLSLIQSGKFVEQDDDSSVSTDITVSSSSGSSRSLQQQPFLQSSSRGLENFTVKGSLKSSVKKLREKSIAHVLVEQDFQVEQAEAMELTYLFYDDKAIRDSYLKFTKISSEAALKRGQEDHEIASGRVPTPKKAPRRQTFRGLFSKKSVPDKEINATAANSVSEKKINTRRWSLKSVKQPKPAA